MQWRLILTLFLMVLVVIFSLSNAKAVPFSYLPGQVREVSLALIIIISALVGAIAGVVASLGSILRLRHQVQEKEHQLRELERDKAELADDAQTRQQMNQRRPKSS